MRAARAAHLVAGAFLAFTAWEVAQHVWLMNLPMALYHMVSLTVDLVLVLLIALTALALVRRQARHEVRQHAMQDAVVAALAQDLRPPLASLLAHLQILQSTPPTGSGDEMDERLKQAEAPAAVLLDMIEDLVAMVTEADETPPRCADLSLRELADRAREALRAVAEDKNVALKVDVAPDLPSLCTAPSAVMRGLSTLLTYALQRTRGGGEVQLRITRDQHDDAILLSVSDTAGPLLDHTANLEDVIAGYSLVGMRYLQALADALGGTTRYEAKPAGNVFTLSLPTRARPE